MEPGAGLDSTSQSVPAPGGCPACKGKGNGELKDWLGGQGDLVESGFPGE